MEQIGENMANVDSFDTMRQKKAMQAQQMQQAQQRSAVEQQAMQSMEANKNGALVRLAAEMSQPKGQVGLVPNEYSLIAGQIADKSPNQLVYSENMVNGVMEGQINPADVLQDESILPEYRQALVDMVNTRNQGLGRLK